LTNDQITIDAAHAIKEHAFGVKCDITPDEATGRGIGLKMWPAPNDDPQISGRVTPSTDHLQERSPPAAGVDQTNRRFVTPLATSTKRTEF